MIIIMKIEWNNKITNNLKEKKNYLNKILHIQSH